MASHLTPNSEAAFQRWLAEAANLGVGRGFSVWVRGPWSGYTPDLDPNVSKLNTAITCEGLLARPGDGTVGEVLTLDAGFGPVPTDADNLPLGGASPGVIRLDEFYRTDDSGDQSDDYDRTVMAVTAGDGVTPNTGGVERRAPSTGDWEVITYGTSNGQPANKEAKADRDSLPDSCTAPFGCPGRSDFSGPIAQPVFIWCSLQDEVFVYAVDDTTPGSFEDGQYEPLSDSFTASFKARTCEVFNGRVYFGNTIENLTHYRRRVRRTKPFDADPDPAPIGAGAFDLSGFTGDLLRLEKLGNVLAAYLEDGVAFIRSTDVATAPDGVDLLRERRGLLSTHALVSVGDQSHFGIFDDGWFFLDPSGRWTEAGVENIDGTPVRKWRDNFYATIDEDNKERLYVSYDGRYIRISFQGRSDSEATRVWIYDPRTDRVFTDTYPQGVTCWGNAAAQIAEATLWSDLSGETWSTIIGSWASFGARFGSTALFHGTSTGYVVLHDYDLTTKWDTASEQTAATAWQFASHERASWTGQKNPHLQQTANRLIAEYVDTGLTGVGMQVYHGVANENYTVDFSAANTGELHSAYATFDFTRPHIGFKVSGSGPILIRSFVLEGVEQPTDAQATP